MSELIILTFIIGAVGLGLGGIIGVFFGGISKKLNAMLLAFSAGTMIALICFELLPEAMEGGGEKLIVAAAVISGAGLVSLLDYIIDKRSGHSHDFITCEDCDEGFEHDSEHLHCSEHEEEHEYLLPDFPHSHHGHKGEHRAHGEGHAESHSSLSGYEAAAGTPACSAEDGSLHSHAHEHSHSHEPESAHCHGEKVVESHHHKRTSHLQLFLAGVMMAVGVAIHNVPEGMSIGAIYAEGGGMVTSSLMMLLISIVLHNIPEGMAISLPLYTSGMSRTKAVLSAAATGLPTVLGALLGSALGDMGGLFLSLSLSFAAGTLLYVVFGEVLPQAINLYCSRKTAFMSIAGLVAGMLIIGGHVH